MADKKKEKQGIVRSHDIMIDEEYVQWMSEVKQRFRSAQIKAAVKVNSEQLLFNWQMGRDLVERKAEEKIWIVQKCSWRFKALPLRWELPPMIM